MNENQKPAEIAENNILETLWNKFFPFWPLFAFLVFSFLLLGVAFSMYKKPTFVVTSTVIITNKDDANRSYSNQPFQSLNPFATTQVVDNEVLILQSRTLMKGVANALHLYAPVLEKRSVSSYSGFITSPIRVEAQNPESLKKWDKVFFEFNPVSHTVKIEDRHYGLNQWHAFPFGTIRFVRNPHQTQKTNRALYFSVNHPTNAAEQLTGNLMVASVSKLSTTINLSYQTDVPDLGEAILNELLQQYLRSSVENANQLASNTLLFVQDRLQEVERELDSIERRIQQFRTRSGAVDLSEQGRIYLQNVAENDRRLVEIDAQLSVMDQVARYLNETERRTGVIPTSLGISDPVLADLLQRLNELELQLANLITTNGLNNPRVRSVENEIQKIRPNIQSIVRNQQAQLRASRNNLTSTSNRINTNIRNIPEQERELLEISRQQAVKRDLYAFLLQRQEEAALSNSSTISDNRVVDWADAKVASQNSGRLIILLACIFAAFALGIAYILFRENFTSKLLFRSNLEKLTSIPVLTEITYRKGRKGKQNNLSTHIVTEKEFSRLQASLGLLQSAEKKQILLVTAFLANEGATYVSRNLAVQLAASGKKVVLLDLNLHQPHLSESFENGDGKGFADLIMSNQATEGFIRSTVQPNLFLLPAGTKNKNTLSLLTNPATESLFHFLRSHYDYIIIDTPPLELAADAYALANHTDCTLLVVRHGYTPVSTIKKLDSNVELKTFKNLYVVLNGVKARGIPQRYYGLGYGYGYEMVREKQLKKLY